MALTKARLLKHDFPAHGKTGWCNLPGNYAYPKHLLRLFLASKVILIF